MSKFNKAKNTPIDNAIDFGPTPAEAAAISPTTPSPSPNNTNTSERRQFYRPPSAVAAASSGGSRQYNNSKHTYNSASGGRGTGGYNNGRGFSQAYQRNSPNYLGNASGSSVHNNAPPAPPPLPDHVDEPLPAPLLTDEQREVLVEPVEKFEDLSDTDTFGGDGVNENLLRGIYSNGFERPSIIQSRAIRPVLSGQDVIAQAQSGMGKTGAFCIGTLGRVNTAINTTQAVVLAHTRELATQIESVFRKICINTSVRITICIGGISTRDNVASLTGNGTGQRPHIVIGTPGRMIDMLTRRDTNSGIPVMDIRGIKMLVIDEADAMLGTTTEAAASGRGGHRPRHPHTENRGFVDEINKIVGIIPENAQICLFSATMNRAFFELVEKFLRNPIKVVIKQDELTLDGIKQFCVDVDEQQYKFMTLCDLYKFLNINQSIIYCNTKRSVEYLAHNLAETGYTVSSIHGTMDHQQREITMADFHSGKSRVLVSTDLLARGIDVQQVSVVINYDLPENVESYIHRIGRSGRYGRKGVAINIITNEDIDKIGQIEQYYSTQIDPLPTNFERLLD